MSRLIFKQQKETTARWRKSGVGTTGFAFNVNGTPYKEPNKDIRIGHAISAISHEMQSLADDYGLEIVVTFKTEE